MATVVKDLDFKFKVLQKIEKDLSHKFEVVRQIVKDLSHKFNVVSQVTVDLTHNFQLGKCSVDLSHSFKVTNPIGTEFLHKFRVLDSDATGTNLLKRVSGKLTIYFKGGSKELPIDSLSITRTKSQPLKWSATVFDTDGTYNPHNSASVWADWLTPEIQDPESILKWVEIEIYTQGGWSGIRKYTDLIAKTFDYSADPEGGYTISISGIDASDFLHRDNQEMETWTNSTAHTIISDILDAYHLKGAFNFPDFPVAQMDFQQDRPINRIQTLLNTVGGFWQMDGKTLKMWIPSIRLGADFTYRDYQNIYLLNMSEQTITHFNKVTACRVTKNADIAYTQEGTSDGRQNGNFSGVFHNPHFNVLEQLGCVIENVDYFYQNNYAGHGFAIAGRADQVYFTVTPIDPNVISRWRVEVRGVPAGYMGSGIDLDASYTYEDTDSITLYGELPAPNIESNFISDNDIAQLAAEAFMREQGRKSRAITISAPINPWLDIAETIKIDEKVSRYNGIFDIDSITTSINGSSGEQTLEVKEYEK